MLSRWARSSQSPASGYRTEVRPPSLRHAPDSAWQRFVFWLMAPAPQDVAPPLNRLPQVRVDFLACLEDIAHADAATLADRIRKTHSLRDLWHVRTDLYRVIAQQHNQFEAERRLARLNRHFPTRAPRQSAF